MQFTELSELNHMVGLMRLASCNSPTFHDRQDSEVDRIFNSSPKMESQLLNSWIDKMAAFKTQPSSSVSSQGLKKSPKEETAGKTREGREKSIASSNGARRRTSTHAGRVDRKSSSTASTKHGEKEDGTGSEKKQDSAFTFEKEKVSPISFHESSMLDKALKGSASSAMGARPPMMGADGGSVLHLTIYLPTRDEMKIDLYDVSTVDEAIQELLRVHQVEARQPALYYGHPECYELRLHDSDGIPDEDFPALDRSRKIKNFGDAGGHEYCLCERPDACPPSSDTPADIAAPASTAKPSAASAKATSANDKAFLKIFMPKSDDYTVVAIDGTTVGQDLLPTLNKKHRLQLFQELYVLKISEAERERLDLASDEIDMHTKLRPLNLHEVTLATKIFADAPQISAPASAAVGETANLDSRSRPPPETFMFNDVTAAMFKEWHIIKKNKYGKKQQRMLGIDLNKIYNRKVGERVITSSKSTKIAERPMSGVVWVRFNQDPSEFQIYFKDSIEEIITDYTADSPYECAEIVAKLKYILSRRK
ncbi:Stress-activated map kinase interacting 1 [Plasmopara halstedii]|uniref:Stress-activated map kinase interacting 1 n=1 Tax=Plasmopara halstedii TaxID=4781 RepID=A0A0P1AXJ7_PLAHL|nr:Stress-activated map kinase interacting 1 [Plasmopara halstedii]CEG46546.1 Stress-activated map kinase interacting 1 [Plasmopara halstedii]|eukprot:XP_024582915.1 Stress-activated map kinase interacting 1 [Plasmopara halstedii]